MATSGGALLAGGSAWHPDGDGFTCRSTDGAAFWEASTRVWHPLPPLPQPRQGHAAVGLPDGRVLLVGGRGDTEMELRTTLLWEPGARRFHEGPSLLAARARPIAVSLADGTVLVLGSDFDDDLARGTRAEVLWPGASAWEPAGQTVRLFHPGPVCASGERVLIAGGRDNGFGFAIIEGQHLAPPMDHMTEVWERASRTWRATSPMSCFREEARGVTLSDGRILVVGGWSEGAVLGTAEVWDPRTGEWSATGSLALPRSGFALTALPGGGAAVSGGIVDHRAATETVALWDPVRGTWAPGPSLSEPREGHQLVEVEPGTFLVVGLSRDAQGGLSTTWEVWRSGA
ncbi:MAG TPA: kelch repeat-containing protein [Cystobacter sp.]